MIDKCKVFRLIAIFMLFVVLSVGTMPVGAGSGSVSGFDADALDAYITGHMSKHGIQGISPAVTSKTEVIYLKGYGTAGDDRPMTPQTPMYIGSPSKSFTGLAIAQLIEQGRIDPNDAVQKYIPWFKVAEEAASKKITEGAGVGVVVERSGGRAVGNEKRRRDPAHSGTSGSGPMMRASCPRPLSL